jgi:hypothetical protein
MTIDSDDIQDTRREEERRGKRPVDISAKKRRLMLLKKFKEALENNDIEAFKEAIINDLGQLPDSSEYRASLQIWHRFHGAS